MISIRIRVFIDTHKCPKWESINNGWYICEKPIMEILNMNKILGRRVMEEMPKEDRKGGKRGDMTKQIEWVREAMSEMKKKKKTKEKE